MMRNNRVVVATGIALGVLSLVGCGKSSPETEAINENSSVEVAENSDEGDIPSENTQAEATEDNSDDDAGDDDSDLSGDMGERLIEREQFMQDQQLPLDGSMLTAVTPEQKQFIAEQRAHVESNGGTWSTEVESLTLALTADACETAILSGHEMSTFVWTSHVDSSPLFEFMLQDVDEAQRSTAEMNIADIMVYGMQYMCPGDFPTWSATFTEVYGQ